MYKRALGCAFVKVVAYAYDLIVLVPGNSTSELELRLGREVHVCVDAMASLTLVLLA